MTRLFALLLPFALSACLSTNTRHPIQQMLERRTVTYDLPAATADYTPHPNTVPETQSWAADGTTVLHQRPLMIHYKTYPKKGIWWIKGNLYCSWFGEGPPPKDPRCYHVRTYDNGTRIHFRRAGFFELFRDEWHGTFTD